MDTPPTTERTPGYLRRLRVSWITVALFAILIAYANGFWFTALQGAVGSIERSQEPFHSWLRDSTLMVPLMLVAVLAALALSRRWFGRSRWKLASSIVLIIVFSTGLSVAELTASAAYDYHLQSQQLAVLHADHSREAVASVSGTVQAASIPGACNSLCAAKRATVLAHLRGIRLAGMKILTTNIVLVLWILALRGGVLWLPPKSRVSSVADDAKSQTALAGALA